MKPSKYTIEVEISSELKEQIISEVREWSDNESFDEEALDALLRSNQLLLMTIHQYGFGSEERDYICSTQESR